MTNSPAAPSATRAAAAAVSSDTEDLPFRHYDSKHRVIAWISQNLCDHLTYTVRHGLLTGMKRKGGLGFLPDFLTGSTDTPERRFWESLPLGGLVVYDIGSFQGLLALFFARHARQVICFEPNPGNRRRLEENLRLNHVENAIVRPIALGNREEVAEVIWDALMPGGTSLDQSCQQQITAGSRAHRQLIQITTLDLDIKRGQFPIPDLLKVDVEGFELAVLQGGAKTLLRHQPKLFLEMHGATMREKKQKTREIINFLEQTGYTSIQHIESGASITSENSDLAAQGHLFCQVLR